MLDEWGAFASLEKTGSGRLLISRIPVRAIRTGSVLAILDPADVTPLHDVLIYDRELAISAEDIRYQSLEFEILDHAEGESTDEIDEVFANY